MRIPGFTAGKILRLGYDTLQGKILDEVTRAIDLSIYVKV
jgi:hypothetical protein